MICTRVPLLRPSLRSFSSDAATYESLSSNKKPAPPPSIKKNTLAPCMDLVKKYDYEHYLCNLLAPYVTRRQLMGLRAYNVELSRASASLRSSAQEKELSRLKLLWWRQTIEDIYRGKAVEAPIAVELKRAVKINKLSKGFLLRLIDARSTIKPYNSLHEVEQAADNTFSTVNYLTMETLGFKSVDIDHAASHLGRCEGLIGLIRSIPFLQSQQTTLIPNTTLAKAGISQTEIIRGENPEKLKDVVHDIASSAHLHAMHCERLIGTLPAAARVGFLPLAPAKLFLERLEKYDFDLSNSRTLVRPPLLYLRLVRRKLVYTFQTNFELAKQSKPRKK